MSFVVQHRDVIISTGDPPRKLLDSRTLRGCSSMVEPQSSKLATRVRFPSSAPRPHETLRLTGPNGSVLPSNSMARLFILELTYHRGLAPVEANLQAHKEYLAKNYSTGRFLASGRKEPRNGGVILATGTRKDMEETIRTDPFTINDAAKYSITEFLPSMTADCLSPYRETP